MLLAKFPFAFHIARTPVFGTPLSATVLAALVSDGKLVTALLCTALSGTMLDTDTLRPLSLVGAALD